MDKIIDRLPSPAGLALWLYALVFLILPAILAYKGFVYVIGIVFFAVGLRPHIESLVAGSPLHYVVVLRGRTYTIDYHLRFPNEARAIRAVSLCLMLITLLILPLVLFAMQNQAQVFYVQLEAQLPEILATVEQLLAWSHEQLPGYIPDVEVQEGAGWQGLSNTISTVAGDAIKDLNTMVQSVFGSIVNLIGVVLEDWVKLIIGAIIVGTILGGWEKEVKMHRAVISNGIKDEALRANVLRFGELFQTGISLFMIGYLEVAVTLSVLFAVSMIILPLGLSFGAILFISVILGSVTAVPKIGGILGMAVVAVLMLTNLEPGLGWFGWTVISFGTGWDMLIRTGLMLAVAKIMGLLEAYSYTPEIIGEKLGMTKMQIIATILIWAVGLGFFGMIWGILMALMFQAALRLAQERAEEMG
ncbi:MAG: hypothetical protein AAGC79_12625 [Pseudomonadota bacterium]